MKLNRKGMVGFFLMLSGIGFVACKTPMNQQSTEVFGAGPMSVGQEYLTFATTFAPNPRYACGYMKNYVDRLTTSPNIYFAAISAVNYNYTLCGRFIEIDIKSECGNGSEIDEGFCQPQAQLVGKKIQAILVDRCADSKKCMPPSKENTALKHDVTVHIDLGPQDKASQNLGDKKNYDIAWRFSTGAYPPIAYVVGTADNPDYIRIGLIHPRGVRSIVFGGKEWMANGTQSEFGGYQPGIRKVLAAGASITMNHADGSKSQATVTCPFTQSQRHEQETIYDAVYK